MRRPVAPPRASLACHYTACASHLPSRSECPCLWPPDRFDNFALLPRLADLPVLLIHGDSDTNVPLWHSDALMALVSDRANKRLVVLNGCDHLHIGSSAEAATAAIAFLQNAAEQGYGASPPAPLASRV